MRHQPPRMLQIAEPERIEMLPIGVTISSSDSQTTCVLPCSEVRAVSKRSVDIRSTSFSVCAS